MNAHLNFMVVKTLGRKANLTRGMSQIFQLMPNSCSLLLRDIVRQSKPQFISGPLLFSALQRHARRTH